jgi:4-hydroxybenzoate polyprenyltransferase
MLCVASVAALVHTKRLRRSRKLRTAAAPDLVLARSTESWGLSGLIDVTTTAWFMCTAHIQDFHDVEGDRRSAGKKTLPMLLSPQRLKVLRAGTATYIIAYGASLLYAGYQVRDRGALVVSVSMLHQVMACILAFRIWGSTSPTMDKATFQKYYYCTALMIQLSLVLVWT